MIKNVKYIVYKEDKYYVSQCLNVEVSSFGSSVEEATVNLKEALDLYFEDESARKGYQKINETLIGELSLSI
jgi:predicted RNase H-like HicB family nuclease